MDLIFNSVFLTLWVILTGAILYFSITSGMNKPARNEKWKKIRDVIGTICELLFILVFPGIGIAITNDKCGEHPFEINSIATSYTLWIVFAIAYLISKYYKRQLSPILMSFIAAALIGGALFCLAVCIHFLPMMMIAVLPVLGLLYLSPFMCLFFLIMEMIRLNNHLKERLSNSLVSGYLDEFNPWLSKYYLGFIVFLTVPVMLAIQTVLYVCGQRPDSIISQFTDSCGYLLSQYQDCSCGGDHYLCSIAANGTKKLVKPVRFGIRANEKIIVNRQLLIANAFENWLEDHIPKFHKVIRYTYDSLDIPVNKWSKHKRMANIIYLLMKPLEWLFLLWLYVFDIKPENRIAKQYLPKKELHQFINPKKQL